MSGNVEIRSLLLIIVVTLGCAKDEPAAPVAVTPTLGVVALENQAVGLMGQFKYDKAVQAYQQLRERTKSTDADGQRYQVDLAIALLNRRQDGDLDRSAALLDEAISREPDDLRATYCRALLHFNDGKTSTAKELFQRVSDADPKDSYAVYYVGQCNFLLNQFEDALERFQHAQQLDPYLRSAYYGAFQAAQRIKDRELAMAQLQEFQKLEQNPRARLAELKYTRMGPKAAVTASGADEDAVATLPEGPLFASAVPIGIAAEVEVKWHDVDDDASPPSITIADIDGDGQSDLFLANALSAAGSTARNAVLIRQAEGFRLALDHPLAVVQAVNAALWGDFDNDGRTDVYLCRAGADQLWRNEGEGTWRNVTVEAKLPTEEFNTVDGACFDADHDGDLDYLLCNADGPRQLLNNNRDGTFQPLAEELKIQGQGGTRQVLLADLDADDDADLVFINSESPHEVFINDRFWDYHQAAGFDEFVNSDCRAAVAADVDVDGQVELFTLPSAGCLSWSPDESGNWKPQTIANADVFDAINPIRLALVDVEGDGQQELVLLGDRGWRVLELSGEQLFDDGIEESTGSLLATCLLQQKSGPVVIGLPAGSGPSIWQPGPGRFPFVLTGFSGKTDKAAEMRSNASGIGVQGVARVGGSWTSIAPFRSDSGPGQSLQPVAIGLGGKSQVDFLRLLWPDGVSQTELNLRPGELRQIAETQRQAGSCPLVFVWDGERYIFVADVLGAGGIGFNLGRAEYYPPRPTESLLLPDELLQPRDGKYVVKLGEPMEEICYFDAVRLVAYDLPPGWELTLDERFGAAEPLPTGEAIYYRNLHLPASAFNDRGDDVTLQVTLVDRIASPLANVDRRFIGLTDEHSVTLTFEQPLDQLRRPTLLFDGWVEYAYSQTAFAAWQAGEQYTEPTIEAQGADGQWHIVSERFGYMAGTPRQSTMPLAPDRLPAGTKKLRITTNMEIYWDRLAVIDAEKCDETRRQELKLTAAVVDDVGYSVRTLYDQRYPVYDYNDRPPFADARHPAGFYTSFGDAVDLVASTDDAVAIIGPGEELHLEFELLEAPLPNGWTRRFVLESDGWCKDADLFTQDAGTVEPLPTRGPTTDGDVERRSELHNKYNNRYRSGY